MNEENLRNLIEFFNLKDFFTDNSPIRLAIVFGITALLLVLAHFICQLLQRRLEKFAASKTASHSEASSPAQQSMNIMDVDLFKKVMRNTRRIIYLIIIYWGLSRLVIGPIYLEITKIVFVTLCIWAAIEFFTAFVPFNIDLYLRRQGTTLKTSQSRSLMPIIKGIIWAIGLTFWLDNLGFHVSTIIAGLGIVGVAVGLAGQAILADFFSYIVILLDKPFRIGDFVVLSDGKAGDVEYMGPKTTHLRNLEDDLIVCANSEMTKGVLINQGSIHEREVVTSIGVAYDTPVELLRKMSTILQEVVDSCPHCTFDRACMLDFGPSNLIFQLIYQISPQKGGIRDFMNTRSQVNISILERFNKEGINMAYPTEHVLLTELDPPAESHASGLPQEQTHNQN